MDIDLKHYRGTVEDLQDFLTDFNGQAYILKTLAYAYLGKTSFQVDSHSAILCAMMHAY